MDIYSTFFDSAKYSILTRIKTGNIIVDTLITTTFISMFGYCFNYFFEMKKTHIFNSIKSFFYKRNCIVLEGKKSSTICGYNYSPNISICYSNRFKSVLEYIIQNIEGNKSIYQIKEFYHNIIDKNNKVSGDTLIINQYKSFSIDDKIFFEIICEKEDDSSDKNDKMTTKTDLITIKIYSYELSLNTIKKYVDNITENYLKTIKNNRSNKRFIYTLINPKIASDEDNSNFNWSEDIFESSKTIQNLFFDGKNLLKDKLDFFKNNKAWYYEKGITYSLGIGLFGPPGTGKTSLIKAMANYLDCHIIILSLKLIKTKRQLDYFFFENNYNSKNVVDSVTFDKKIIVMEDIDCIGDIILDRSKRNNMANNSNNLNNNNNNNNNNDNIKISDLIQGIVEINNDDTSKILSKINVEDPPITLDDILNVFDGIRETPGRIMIISSNHYDQLDPALTRPGRIDITLELTKASHNTISELYKHLFNKEIDAEKLAKVKEYYYSPAELINIYISHKDENEFMNRLLETS
jgi:hypothetical protein